MSNTFGCPCHAGLYFEAYTPGDAFDFTSLAGVGATAGADVWVDGWVPITQHEEHTDTLWCG